MFAQCRSREGCFRMYPVASREIVNWMEKKECRPKQPSKLKIQHERPDQCMTSRTGIAKWDSKRASDVPGYQQGGDTGLKSWKGKEMEAAALSRVIASDIQHAGAIADGNARSRRHYGLGRKRSSIARRSFCMAFLQHMWHAPRDRSADVRAHGQ